MCCSLLVAMKCLSRKMQCIFKLWHFFFLLWRCDPTRVMASSILRFLDHTQRRTTVGRTPLDKWSACCRDLYLTTHNIHNRQISMPPVGFEPTISAGERQQTYALDRAATGTGTAHKHTRVKKTNTVCGVSNLCDKFFNDNMSCDIWQ